MKILKHLSLAIIILLIQSPANAGLTQLIRPANPIPSHPSSSVPWLPGFTERDVFMIALANDCNHGIFANVSYEGTTTAESCRSTYEACTKQATDFSEDSLYQEYQNLKKNNKRGTFALKKTLLIEKINKALTFMLAQDDKFSGFYRLHKHFILKQSMLNLIKKIEAATQTKGLFKRQRNILASKEYAQLLRKIGLQLLNHEETLLKFNILNDNSVFEKRKEVLAKAIFPLAKPIELLSDAYAKTAPHMSEKKPVISRLFMEHLDAKHDALIKKIRIISKKVDSPVETVEWQESLSKDVSIFTADNSLQKQPIKPKPRKKPSNNLSLHPFGTMPSAPSPIPGLSWRRLAEIFSTNIQTFHASDFSTVMDWPSFFSFMQNNIPAKSYNNSLFAKFLRIYAPVSYHDLFSPEKTLSDFLSPQDLRKRYFVLINSIIERLQNPHKAYVKYTTRTNTTLLEAKLLLKLLTLYQQGEKELTEFPQVLYKIYNENAPLRQRFAPNNIGLRVNTHNTELYKLIRLFQKLHYLETVSDSTNKHSTWSGSAAALKAPLWAGSLVLTAPARAIQTTLPTKEKRITQTAQAQAKRKESLLRKIEDGIVRLQRTVINQTYSKHIVHPAAVQKKTPKAEDFDGSIPAEQIPLVLKATHKLGITGRPSKEQPQQHSIVHEPETPMLQPKIPEEAAPVPLM